MFGRLAQDPLAILPVKYGGLDKGINFRKMKVKRHYSQQKGRMKKKPYL